MKYKVPIRVVPIVLSGLLSLGLSCGKKNNKKETYILPNMDKGYFTINEEEKLISNIEEKNIQLEEQKNEELLTSEESNICFLNYVNVLENTNIYNDINCKKKIGLLIKGTTSLLLNEHDSVYEIKYDGKSAYINKEKAEIISCYENPYEEKMIIINSIEDVNNILGEINVVTATSSVNVREKRNTKCKKLDKLNVGESLPLIKEYDEWYEVNYYGKSAFVYKKYAKIEKNYSSKIEMLDLVYITSETPFYDIDTNKKLYNIPTHEVAEVYAKKDYYYLVKCRGKFGYVYSEQVCSLGDSYVIIDITSQLLKVYINDKLIVTTYVVTGKDSSKTYCGLFSVREKKRNVRWDEFKVTVKYWAPFNRGEGMHDADWRSEFGGDIYHKKGSHGCVNIPPDVMPIIYDLIYEGIPVLVKK